MKYQIFIPRKINNLEKSYFLFNVCVNGSLKLDSIVNDCPEVYNFGVVMSFDDVLNSSNNIFTISYTLPGKKSLKLHKTNKFKTGIKFINKIKTIIK